jgi:hypothetical protein
VRPKHAEFQTCLRPVKKAPSGSRTRTSAMARRQAAATSWARLKKRIVKELDRSLGTRNRQIRQSLARQNSSLIPHQQKKPGVAVTPGFLKPVSRNGRIATSAMGARGCTLQVPSVASTWQLAVRNCPHLCVLDSTLAVRKTSNAPFRRTLKLNLQWNL